MAFGASLVWEVQPLGSDVVNGGGFDYSTTFATDLAAVSGNTATPTVSAASYNFGSLSADSGAYLFIGGGTNWVKGMYPLLSIQGNTATINAAVGAVVLYQGATPTNTGIGCSTVASPTGATWSMDYSRSNTAPIVFTDMVIDGATNTKFTSAAQPLKSNVVGNVIAITGGVGFTVQRVEINSVVNGTGTVDKSLGTLSSTAGLGSLGGALASPGQLGAVPIAATTAMIKQATYNLGSSSNVSGGRLAYGATFSPTIIGYSTNRYAFNTDTRPIFQTNANSIYCITTQNAAGQNILNIDFENGNGNTAAGAINGNSSVFSSLFWNLKVNGLKTGITNCGGGMFIINCTVINATDTVNGAISCSLVSVNGGLIHGCTVINSPTPFSAFSTCAISNCIAAGNAAVGHGFATFGCAINCTAYSISGAAVNGFNACTGPLINCIADTCTVYGFDASNAGQLLINCAGRQNGTANFDSTHYTPYKNIGFISLTGSPFVLPLTNVSGDFSLNTTAGAGALLRAAGFPGTYPGLSTVSYYDIGAVQHIDPVSTASANIKSLLGSFSSAISRG